ncbi:Mitochondrial Carrier (MC) Family [Thraustotheca clavata]|uniref:Mitochondrial Carrier (MC) Family n=1 Tax=Thraustotheca clavata TaxID=74557 RepID=A0A1V9Y8J3_9STRA|nr:Mitochondrial Carrier (MC) Family [Thraustotheca clavata]
MEESLKKSGVASIGALLTALLVTPLEVAKTRLQAQIPTTSVLSTRTTLATYCYCTHYSFSSGLMDHLVSKAQTNLFPTPIEAGSHHLHPDCPVHAPPVKLRGTAHALSHIIRVEGVGALYAGLSPMLLIAIPSTVFYFTSYDLLLSKARKDTPQLAPIAPFFAGGIARCIAATVVSPLELIRVRMQAHANAGGFAYVVKQSLNEGFFSLWRGLAPTLARDAPFSSIYWSCFELLKKNLTNKFIDSEYPPAQIRLGIAFVSGASAGTVATILTQPFDVIKTKRQIQLFSATELPSMSMKSMMIDIVKHEGFGGLMTGLSARVAKVAPACAIMISTYEAGKQYLGVE